MCVCGGGGVTKIETLYHPMCCFTKGYFFNVWSVQGSIKFKLCYVAVCNNYAICNKLQTALNCNAVCNTLQTAFRVLKNPIKRSMK